MPPPLQGSGVIAAGNDRSDEGIAPYEMAAGLRRSGKQIAARRNVS
jgi:hypothetical protein